VTENTDKRIGDYQIIRELGHGGMGKVYLVRNVLSDRIEAMKVVLPDLAGQSELVSRFMREIKVLASLEHPNIAALRTAFTAENQFVMIMEYVEGETLAQRVEQGPLSTADALNYIGQVLDALSYAHGKHVIHRDIKPGNMMLTPQRVVKLMDFGLARSGEDFGLTATGSTVGSLAYMSPEQVTSQPIDARSDLYSVGVSLYEMVTGQHMFSATSSYSLMEAQVKETPRPPIEIQPSLPKVVSDVIMMAVAKDPAQRFQSADAFRNALSQIGAALPQTSAQVAAAPAAAPAGVGAPSSSPGFGGRVGPAAAQPVVTPAPAQAPYPYPAAAAAPAPQSKPNRVLLAVAVLVLLALLTGGVVYKSRQHNEAIKGSVPSAVQNPASQDNTASQVQGGETTSPSNSQPANVENAAPQTPAEPIQNGKTAATPVNPATRAEQQAAAARAAAEQAAAEAEAAAQKKLLDEMEAESDQLDGRAAAVESSLDTLEQQMRQSGVGLRGDMAAARSNLRNDMTKAKQALDAADTERARRYLDLAQREVEKLETFLGRR
jgi:eukaryotic-like serine/threonine-protein kinase